MPAYATTMSISRTRCGCEGIEQMHMACRKQGYKVTETISVVNNCSAMGAALIERMVDQQYSSPSSTSRLAPNDGFQEQQQH